MEVSVTFGSGQDALENDGLIVGEVRTAAGADRVENRGVIDGVLATGDGDDEVRNSGEVWIAVDLGAGDDRYDGRGGGSAGLVAGGRGDDVYVISNPRAEIVEEAGGGWDVVRTSVDFSGAEHVERVVATGERSVDLAGTGGDERLVGNRGDNRLLGGAGDDRLMGRAGDDTLEGGRGADRLHGGAGADVLEGGRGADRMKGGSGGDVFVWTAKEEAGIRRGERDVVRDFDPAEDVIDLSAVSWYGLRFQEGGRFSGSRSEVRISEKGGSSWLRVDANADGDSDMTIILRGVTGLGEDDLLL